MLPAVYLVGLTRRKDAPALLGGPKVLVTARQQRADGAPSDMARRMSK